MGRSLLEPGRGGWRVESWEGVQMESQQRGNECIYFRHAQAGGGFPLLGPEGGLGRAGAGG